MASNSGNGNQPDYSGIARDAAGALYNGAATQSSKLTGEQYEGTDAYYRNEAVSAYDDRPAGMARPVYDAGQAQSAAQTYRDQRGTVATDRPYGNYYFALEFNKIEVAHFMECSGLKSTSEVFEIEEGGLNGRSHKRAGQSRWENLTLRYASSASLRMMQWRESMLRDQFAERMDGAVILKDNQGEVIRRWNFKNAWPVSWEGPTFNSDSSELAIESIEIAHDGLTVVDQ